MSIHRFDHIDLRASNFAEAREFCDLIFPTLGFPQIRAADTEVTYSVERDRKTSRFVCLSEEPGHRRNATRFPSWADTEAEVNRLGAIIRAAGAPAL